MLDSNAKGERFIRERHVDNVVCSHLNEHATRRSALMELSSRVQEAWPIAGGIQLPTMPKSLPPDSKKAVRSKPMRSVHA